MSNSKKVHLINMAIGYMPIILSFLLPIFFLPITVEFFEFNKFALITVVSIVLMVLWAAKIVLTKKVIIAKSKLDLALGVFTLTMILSTVFSIHQISSLFGSSGRWFPSLFAFLSFFVFYYITASNGKIKAIKLFSPLFVAGTAISTLLSTLAYYNVYLGDAAFLKIQNFSLSGSSSTSAILAAFAAVISVIMVLKTKNFGFKSLYTLSALFNLYFVLLVRDWNVVALMVVGLAAVPFFMNIEKNFFKENQVHTALLVVGALILVLSTNLPVLADVTLNKNFAKPVVLSLTDSWRIASSTVREFPILGTGPSTFYLNFPRYRTLSMNSEIYWNFRFDKPFNEVLNIMATLGIVGFVALLMLGTRIFRLAWEIRDTKEESGVVAVLSVTLLMSLGVYFITYASVTTTFLMFLAMALAVAYKAGDDFEESIPNEDYGVASLASLTNEKKSDITKKEYLHFIAITPILAVAGVAGFFLFRLYVGEYWMRKSIEAAIANNGNMTYTYQVNAINTNPRMDTYHNAYAQTNLALANALAGKQNLTDQEKQTIQSLVAQSIKESRASTEVLNPLNVAGWETRASIYSAIAGIAQDADKWAISAYNSAIQLDPTNPLLRIQLGGLYFAQKDYLNSANQFRSAITLKPDYANGHYNFAQSLLQLKDYQNAVKALEATKRLVGEGTPDANKVDQEIANIKAMPEFANAQAAAAKPTVDEISSAAAAKAKATQEPLKSPTQLNQVNTQSQVQPTTPVVPTPQTTTQPAPTENQ